MATITYVHGTRALPDPILGEGVTHRFAWTALGQGDDGQPVEINGRILDLVVQASGTFSGSATVALEGSNDGASYGGLRDETGTAIALADAAPKGVSVVPLLIRPAVSGGDGSTDVDVVVIVRTAGD